jgi:hypothetical protein
MGYYSLPALFISLFSPIALQVKKDQFLQNDLKTSSSGSKIDLLTGFDSDSSVFISPTK